MELSILIARIAAVTYLTTGIALLIGSLDLQKTYEELKKSQMFTALMGAFTLLLGMLIVNSHKSGKKEGDAEKRSPFFFAKTVLTLV